MMYDTPEERGCQAPSNNETPLPLSNTSGYNAEKERIAAFKQKMDEGLTSEDLNEIISELGHELAPSSNPGVFEPVSEKKKSLEETKKLITNFKEKVAKYPKHLSYEGSVVICVMLSMKEVAYPDIANLPLVDQTLIRSLLPPELLHDVSYFEVTFDENKDFVLKFKSKKFNSKDNYELIMFNSVAHPRPEDLKDMGAGTVPIEKDGDKIAIGGHIKLNPRTVRIIMGKPVPPEEERASSDLINTEERFSSKRPASNRNAYEIRADVLQMALEWCKSRALSKESDVLDVAKKFYEFVEDRRRR